MTEQMLRWIRTEQLIEQGDHVMVGLSGGADSVCLLLLLEEVRETLAFTLSAVHVEHGIRGEESVSDARFAEELCRTKQIPCTVYAVDAAAYAREKGVGLEEAARTLRYECYRKAAKEYRKQAGEWNGTIRVALAHHADDNAETILFQMARGSGLTGLCGMPPKRCLAEGTEVIRPLLPFLRTEIEAYLEKKGQTFRIDSTNDDINYSRNRLRHMVLPQLAQVNPKAAAHISKSGAMLAEVRDYLREQAAKAAQRTCRREAGGILLSMELFAREPAVVRKELIHELLAETAGSAKDFGEVHVEAVLHLAAGQVGREITLPGGICAKRVYEGVFLCPVSKKPVKEIPCPAQEAPIPIPAAKILETLSGGTLLVCAGNLRFSLRLYPAKTLLPALPGKDFQGKINEIAKKRYTKWLDYDKIQNGLVFRKRQSGDYFVLDEAGHKKKLKAYFIEEKVPKQEREQIWLLADGSHILWAAGGRLSAACRITQDTRQILEIQMTGGNENED